MNRLFAALLLLALPVPALAADPDGNFAVDGIGAETCQHFVAEREKNSNYYFMYGGWLDGYLTAINQYTSETFDLTAWETTDLLMALIDRHCRQNPDQQFIGVAVALARNLSKDKLAQSSAVVEAKVGERTIRLYQATMARVQDALKAAGFYAGGVDGQFGPQSQEALTAFQTAKGLEVTGLPDQRTLMALLRPSPAEGGETQP
jgi:hypothetical protein